MATIGIYGIKSRNGNLPPGYTHDHSLTKIVDGEIKSYIQLERLTRLKNDNSMDKWIELLLKDSQLDISPNDDFVFVDSFAGRGLISKNGVFRFEAPLFNTLKPIIEKGNLWIGNSRRKTAYILNHEFAHVCSNLPFYGAFKENSLLIHLDGGASQSNFSAWTYKNNQFKSIEYSWDLKEITDIFQNNKLVFKILGLSHKKHAIAAGKIMGYSSYGTPNKRILNWLRQNKYFSQSISTKDVYSQIFRSFNIRLTEFDPNAPLCQDIVATMQFEFTTKIIEKLRKIRNHYKLDHLYYSGGCALNIRTNTAITESNIFKSISIPPCCDDSGLSLGAAAFFDWKKNQNQIKIHTPFLNNYKIEFKNFSYSKKTIEKLSALLLQNKIIGICNGFGEIGPRGLGNRSIVALPFSIEMKNKISVKMKGREWYRPLAPIMLEKNAKMVTGLKEIPISAKYMLNEFQILDSYKQKLQGIMHINGTARIQVLFDVSESPFMYDLLCFLDEKYSVPCLINTSFNKCNEPIVQTSIDAINSANDLGIEYLVINGEIKKM